jgi:uncharacterized membrane protein YgcG
MRTLTLSLMCGLLAAPSWAQNDGTDPRWSDWLGCWELLDDNVRDEGVDAGEVLGPRPPSAGRSAQRSGSSQPRVCVAPGVEGGVTLQTRIGAQDPLVQTIVADGTERPIEDAQCRGTQRAEWSEDGRRLFAHAELSCTDGLARTVSGLTFIARDGTWLDIQSVRIGPRESVRVRRYRRGADTPPPATPRAALPLTLNDVKEAHRVVSPRVIEAALVETRAGFSLDSRRLMDLSDAGVSEGVIDVIVALSYPNRFIVERRQRADVVVDPFPIGGTDLFLYDPLFFMSPYYYSPFGYYGLSRYNPWGLGPGVLIGVGEGGAQPRPRPSGSGRVVNDLGYTRVRPRDAVEPAESGPAPAAGTALGASPRTTHQPSSGGDSSAGHATGGSTVTSQGFSSGGSSGTSGGASGGDSGRTAVPR